MKKILIANRGEIAVRIIRSCREMGIKTVAVYSDADRESLHVRLADESVCIGGPHPTQSYLNAPNIISAALIKDAEAIHPGYGFLAENSSFAEACEDQGIKFIGPPVLAMVAMGAKAQARSMMAEAGVPVVPGSPGLISSSDEIARIAEEIGYPVMVKASAGGGGRGMRIAMNSAQWKSPFKWPARKRRLHLGMAAFIWRNLLPSRGILNFRFWLMSMVMWCTWGKGTVPFRGGTRSWWKRPPALCSLRA